MSKTVVLDIGHGSDTYPAKGKGVRVNGVGYAEHNFNSKLALKTESLLSQSGIKVVMYQKPYSKDIALSKRTSYYKGINPDLIVSQHANGGAASASGRCVFYWGASAESKKAAGKFVKEIENKGYSTHGNGLHASVRGSWTNLHMTRVPSEWSKPVPSVLIEYGFMTNTNGDFKLIFGSDQEKYTDDMAEATAKAICSCLGVTYKGGKASSGGVKPSPSVVAASGKVYEVKSGDTLWAIGQANGVTVDELLSLNGLKTNVITPGMKLVVKIDTDKKDEVILSIPDTYKVESGDTLGEVSNEFNVSLDNLVKWNNISNPDVISVGTVLKLKPSAVVPSKPKAKPVIKLVLKVDGAWGEATAKRAQEVLGTYADGIISGQYRNDITENIYCVSFGKGGSSLVKAIQAKVGVKQDGYLGVKTITAMQRYFGTPVTGKISKSDSSLVKAMQTALNNGRF